MKRAILLAVFVLAILCPTFAKEISVRVEGGENWSKKGAPQFAIWLEDSDGNYVKTIYVTERASRLSWFFGPKAGRPESLPVWYHASKHESAKSASGKKDQNIDAVTSATPKSSIDFAATLDDREYVAKAEFNVSFDYNDFYTKKNSGVNGQPSVIYQAKISSDFSTKSGEIEFVFCGSGSLDGSDGKIIPGQNHLTSAKSIVKRLSLGAR